MTLLNRRSVSERTQRIRLEEIFFSLSETGLDRVRGLPYSPHPRTNNKLLETKKQRCKGKEAKHGQKLSGGLLLSFWQHDSSRKPLQTLQGTKTDSEPRGWIDLIS